MMKTIPVRLKQHTPLLHFQSTQDGATLRASEVKPRFDAFLRARGIPIPRYKMRITADGERIVRRTEERNPTGNGRINNAPMFFGSGKKLVSNPTVSIHLTIIEGTINPEHLVSFFAQNNFGTRQSKGYGSFTVKTFDGTDVLASLPREYVSYYELEGVTEQSVFRSIELLHKTLRSGLNGQSPFSLYFKSLLFSFAEYRGKVWDKKIIKQHFLSKDIKKTVEATRRASYSDLKNRSQYVLPAHSDHNNPNQYRQWIIDDNGSENSIGFDFRDYLGLSTNETWMSYDNGQIVLDEHAKPKFVQRTDKRTGNKTNELVLEKMTVTKSFKRVSQSEDQSDSKGRFKSPMLYKPVKLSDRLWRIYVIVDEDAQESIRQMNSKTMCYGCSNMPGAEPFELEMAPAFSMIDYLRYAFSMSRDELLEHFSVNRMPVDVSRLSDADKKRYYSILSMYSQLSNNLQR